MIVVVAAHAPRGIRAVESAEPPAASRLSAIEVLVDARGLVVTLAGDGRLQPSAVWEAEQWPPRILLDLPNVAASVPGITSIGVGPVSDVRVTAHSLDPLVTRVVFELTTRSDYQIHDPKDAGGPLRLVFPIGPAAGGDSQNRLLSRGTAGGGPSLDGPQPGVHTVLASAVVKRPGSQSDQPTSPGADPRERLADALGGLDAGRARAQPLVPPALDPFGGLLGNELGRERLVSEQLRFRFDGSPTAPGGVKGVLPHHQLRDRRVGNRPAADGPSLLAIADVVVGIPLPLTHSVQPAFPGVRDRRSGENKTPTGLLAKASTLIRPSARPAATAGLQQVAQGEARQYTGDPVSMDFQGADLRAVLRTFAEISGLNVVIDPQVDGTVDVALTDVPWDQALDVILRTNRLGYIVDGTVVRIAPLSALAEEEMQRRELAEEQALAGQLVVVTRTLNYARAEAMAELVAQSVLSARGQVQIDERTNTIILTDLQPRLSAAEELLDTLDRAEPQVEIEARIVQAGQEFARSIGVQWGLTGRVAPDLGNTTPLTFPNRGGVSGRLGTQGPEASGVDARAGVTENTGTAINLPATAATSALGVSLGAVDGSLNLDVVISAAERDGDLRLLSHPRVTTQNNGPAEIVQGDQIPIQTVSNNTVTVDFRDAALSLRVTPQITAEDTVIMQIEIDNDFADFRREINGVPPIVTQRASTTVQVADGDTTVIGGIFESEQSSSNNRVPGLHRIPFLGRLFRSESDRESSDELLIFLTPRVIR
jgi:type IV pilus assembly protein PilQ